MQNGSRSRLRITVNAVLVLLMAPLFGCSSESPSEQVTITVNYPSAQQFYKLYGYAFEKANPGITVQVMPEPAINSATMPTTDVVVMNSLSLLKQRAERGDLLALTPIIRKGKYEVESLTPIVLSMLKGATEGELYGLTAHFQSDALFYNKKLFEQYQIPLPRNQMTWEEVLLLAERFPKQTQDGKPLYGLQLHDDENAAIRSILDMGATEGLVYMDPDSMQITMNTASWEKIWTAAVGAFQSGAIYDPKKGENADRVRIPPFNSEQAAMTVASFMTAYQFEQLAAFPNGRLIDWGMVTAPVDPRSPDQSRSYSVYEIYGISSSTEHRDAAWKLIKFIVDDSANQSYLAKANPNLGLPSNLEYIQPIPEHDLSPLYRLNPAPEPENPYSSVDGSILEAFTESAQNVLDQAVSGDLTIKQALAEVESEGQRAIDDAKNRLSEVR
ncbi:ABC transporter substrate-binding protein [Cohnella sp. AR92]|uniref:ABC transporter substrate-binding protein n=1 Tax=Cohnella sp. AR92 TaxID=648716 RepID=UPI000F8DD291|nr:ABC transporter substrate-binding protein [Cohnella sp. AR92]RUS45984.1 carbohydrate ABC transporter substrate-binding protein [Cohnella sp. AR92]